MEQQELTDDATELANLAQTLTGGTKSPSGFHHLASRMRVKIEDSIFLELLIVVTERLSKLREFVEAQPANEIPKAVRGDILAAIQNFTTFLNADFLATGWNADKAKIVSENNVQSLRWFGAMVLSRHRPLHAISIEQINEVLARLSAKIDETSGADYFEWEKPLLIGGLRRIQTTLVYLPYFGHERAIAELFVVVSQAQALYREIDDDAPSASKKKASIYEILGVVGFAMNLFLFADQGAAAIDRYHKWMIEYVGLHTSKSPQRLLPPPVAKEAEPPEIEEPPK